MKYIGSPSRGEPPPEVYHADIEYTEDYVNSLSVDDFEQLLDESINEYGHATEVECMAEQCLEDVTSEQSTNIVQVSVFSGLCLLLISCLVLYWCRMRREEAHLNCAKKRRTLENVMNNYDDSLITPLKSADTVHE